MKPAESGLAIHSGLGEVGSKSRRRRSIRTDRVSCATDPSATTGRKCAPPPLAAQRPGMYPRSEANVSVKIKEGWGLSAPKWTSQRVLVPGVAERSRAGHGQARRNREGTPGHECPPIRGPAGKAG